MLEHPQYPVPTALLRQLKQALRCHQQDPQAHRLELVCHRALKAWHHQDAHLTLLQ